MTPAERLDALAAALHAGDGVLPADLVTAARAVQDRAGERLRLSPDHTVAAVAGATGSGKSSLVNALVGEPVAEVDVLRPTTSEALAVVRGTEGAGALLDWLAVRRRHSLRGTPDVGAGSAVHGPSVHDAGSSSDGRQARPGGRLGAADPGLGAGDGGLIVLDLPDHDSVRTEHRLEAERLVRLVDLMVWVTDPQKYADAALHERYLRGLHGHAEVMLVVLNQVDRLSTAERAACHRDLERLLAEDGLAGVPVLDVSARTGEGVPELRLALDDAARRRQAATARITADVADVARRVLEHCGTAPGPTTEAREELVTALEVAAGVPTVVAAVRASWQTRARQATGWPPTRWLARFRPDPLRRLHLSRPVGDARDADVVRTSLPPPGPAERARARGAVRSYADAAAQGAPDRWVLAARDAAERADLADALDQAVAGTSVQARPAWWWTVVGALQWLLLAVLVVGGVWLAGLAVLDALMVPWPDPPRWGEVPWPTVALVGGALAGLLLAALARAAAAVGARRRARRARARLRSAVTEVADELVVAPVDTVLDAQRECREHAARAAQGGPDPARGRRRPR